MGIASINPATGETFAKFDALTAKQIEAKLQRSTAAFALNRARSFTDRAERMNRCAELLEQRAAEYGRVITLEMGKPIKASIAEVQKCAIVCRYYAENAESFLDDEPV